jgi:hypothetical protein
VKAATVAISAAFLERETKIRELGFARYRSFLYRLFPGAEANWFAIQRSNCPHVLTFNYDQAFEIAFLDRFDIHQYSLYGQRVLNSGLNLDGIGFEPESFSFLKLHGSVGMWATDFPSDPIYQQRELKDGNPLTIDDRLFFTDSPAAENPNLSTREPLLFFPNQRQFIVSNESGFLFHKYAKAVWDRATELISNATEIHVIGYSFSGIDQGPILDFLGLAHGCQRIVVQSPDADQICNRLKLERSQFRNLVESAAFAF